MASATTKNAESVDSKPEEQDAPEPEHQEEPPSAYAADQGKDEATATEAGVSADRVEFGAFDEHDDAPATLVSTATSGGFGAGAAAVVSAGLGVVSLTGTGLGDMLRSRKEIIGQIKIGGASGGRGIDQVDALYGAPWHTAALVNGLFALVALLIGVGLLAAYKRRTDAQPWVRAIAFGGSVLGAIGVLIAVGMYFDLFAAQPALST